MAEFLIALGYLGLFLAAFLAATILPFGSEPILVALLYTDLNTELLLTSATIGNTLGGLTSYGLGYLGKISWIEKWLKVSHQRVAGFEKVTLKYGYWTALLCWLPIVGDVLAIALGLFRVNFWRVAILMALGKGVRYWLLIYFFT